MPIIDYKHQANTSEKWFFNQNDISETNKNYVKDFLEQYDVSSARRSIFLKHIAFLLREVKDVSFLLNDRKKVNSIFNKFRQKLSSSYYSTIINVSKRFVRWLNDGDSPLGFKDIKNTSKKSQKRTLSPNDMITWEEGLNIANEFNSQQFKAIILTQLDGGFRPSEFIDLNYGDVEIKKNFVVANVKDGKTGQRLVILFRSAPYLIHWYNIHPTKKADDPLWVMEQESRSNKKDPSLRYNYYAIKKRIRNVSEKLKFKKPVDFYNFRHSACFLAKMDNLPIDECAKKFGHSVEHFTNTYGRLSVDDSIERLTKHYEIDGEKIDKPTNINCSRCDTINSPNLDYCTKCGSPLSLNIALKMEKDQKDEINKLKEEVYRIANEQLKLKLKKS